MQQIGRRRIVGRMAPVPLLPDQLVARRARDRLPHPSGGHCKSLFLKDGGGVLWLLVALETRRIDLKRLADTLGAPRFSFGSPGLLYEALGVRPGGVTPFGLVNDTADRVKVVLDRAMLDHEALNCDPLQNDRTTAIGPADLLRFIASCGHRPLIIELDPTAPAD